MLFKVKTYFLKRDKVLIVKALYKLSLFYINCLVSKIRKEVQNCTSFPFFLKIYFSNYILYYFPSE
jgi:hypothetical protein